ncbi:glutaminase [Oesophagostomum dentatum]|uniref:glutaminase n=1 Tax=Oesophagostomum dentatum TaxID=61180 RepID=A0A0B1TPP0_OESDE|nr:glutaminase [Oesophagostomum dentatum]
MDPRRILQKIPSEKRLEDITEKTERSPSIASLFQTLRCLSVPYDKDTSKSQEDAIFDIFKVPGKNEASIGRLLTVIKSFGLRIDDPRFKPMMRKLKQIEKEQEAKLSETTEPKHWRLDKELFKECVAYGAPLIARILQNNLVIPSWHSFVEQIRVLYEECSDIRDGTVATYIPQLARQSPNYWGVSICTVDGQRVSFGDAKVPFCIQSVSKAFNYAIAASDLGADYVHTYVGEEPSGRLFNEICLDSKTDQKHSFAGKPHNPMVNSGAIIITSLIKNTIDMADRFDYVSYSVPIISQLK